ncbi:MAG: ABC transporter ATP-binding protein [Clostridia bacterium]
MAENTVEVKNVSLIYHEKTAETLAIENLSFDVCNGEFVAIVGPSGCGKTSILSLLSGLIKPTKGSVYIQDNSPGYMLQHDHLLDWRTIEGNIILGLQVKHMLSDDTRSYALRLLDSAGLSEFRNHYPRQLSGGMRQKVALIRTLAVSPQILLLDEPFSALDFQTRLKISDDIYSIIKSQHKTAILVTHDISEAISMSDRILVFSKRPASLKNQHIIKLSAPPSPIARRNAPEFKDYFDTIWKELDDGEA